jgi:hypothetical protein
LGLGLGFTTGLGDTVGLGLGLEQLQLEAVMGEELMPKTKAKPRINDNKYFFIV